MNRPGSARGFATSGAYVVIALAALLALSSLYAAAANTTERVADAREQARERTGAVAASSVTVAGATYNRTAGELTVRANNTGERALRVERTDLVVDGRYVPLSAVDTVRIGDRTDPTLWRPGEQLVLTDARGEPDRLQLAAENGLADAAIVTVHS